MHCSFTVCSPNMKSPDKQIVRMAVTYARKRSCVARELQKLETKKAELQARHDAVVTLIRDSKPIPAKAPLIPESISRPPSYVFRYFYIIELIFRFHL